MLRKPDPTNVKALGAETAMSASTDAAINLLTNLAILHHTRQRWSLAILHLQYMADDSAEIDEVFEDKEYNVEAEDYGNDSDMEEGSPGVWFYT